MDAINEADLMAMLDTFALRFMEMNEPIVFRAAQSPAEREAVYRLRYEEVIERGWAKPEDHPDGLEYDADDAEATQIAAWDGDTLAGAARLIFPKPGQPLPVETIYDIVLEPRYQVVYLSRMLIAPAYRGKGHHGLLMGLISKSWLETRAQGLQHFCGVFSETVMPVFQKVGISAVPLGAPQEFLGETRYACYIDMIKTGHGIMRQMTSERNL